MTQHETSQTAQTARETAAELAEKTRTKINETAHDKAESVRDNAAHEVDRAAQAADAAAGEFDSSSIQAQAIHRVADALEDAALQVRSTDIDRLARNVSDFARGNPGLFIGGAAFLGFAATRFLKARDPKVPAWSWPGSEENDPMAEPRPDLPYDLTTRGAV